METRIFELNHVSNQSQIRLKDTTAVLKTLEERLRSSEVRDRTTSLPLTAADFIDHYGQVKLKASYNSDALSKAWERQNLNFLRVMQPNFLFQIA